jgi:hypothetical protein
MYGTGTGTWVRVPVPVPAAWIHSRRLCTQAASTAASLLLPVWMPRASPAATRGWLQQSACRAAVQPADNCVHAVGNCDRTTSSSAARTHFNMMRHVILATAALVGHAQGQQTCTVTTANVFASVANMEGECCQQTPGGGGHRRTQSCHTTTTCTPACAALFIPVRFHASVYWTHCSGFDEWPALDLRSYGATASPCSV